MEDELDKLFSELEKKPDPAESGKPDEGKPEEEKKEEQKVENPELKKKEEHLKNLNRAIEEAGAELQRIRKEKKDSKGDDDELPKIDFEDPSAKAWDKHFSGKVHPIQEEMEKERKEVRTIALKEFLGDHPGLAKNPEKVKEIVAVYDRIRSGTERIKEGVLEDLKKAYGAVYGETLLEIARKRRIDEAKAEEIFAQPAISRGATSYSEEGKPASSGKTKVSKREWDEMKYKWGWDEKQLSDLYTLS